MGETRMDTELGECWELEGPKRKGYIRLRLGSYRTRNYIDLSAHRVAWMAVHGPIPDGGQILHRCDNRACVRASHLYLGGNENNVRDRVLRMRSARKLSDKEVLEIRRRYGPFGRGGDPGTVLAKEFGVSRSQISLIVNRKERLAVRGDNGD